MTAAPQTMLMAWIGLLLFPVGLAAVIYVTLTVPDSPLHRAYDRYSRHLDQQLRAMFIQQPSGRYVTNWQLGIIAALLLFEPAHLAVMGQSSGLPIALDSPGMSPSLKGAIVAITVPVTGAENVNFDAVAASLQVHPEGKTPLLCVTGTYKVASGNLSLPGVIMPEVK